MIKLVLKACTYSSLPVYIAILCFVLKHYVRITKDGPLAQPGTWLRRFLDSTVQLVAASVNAIGGEQASNYVRSSLDDVVHKYKIKLARNNDQTVEHPTSSQQVNVQ